jgi:adenylate kinase family enzyme
MNKVLILGCAGSGKSTFSKHLGKVQQLPVIHLDSLYWKSGWVASTEMEWNQIIEELILKDQYIMDGNYSRTLSIRMKDADTIFFFDFSRFLCMYQVIKRRIINHGKTRSDMAEGCKEKIDLEFIKWIWNFKKRSKDKILGELEEVKEQKKVIIFKNRRDVKNYIKANL